MEAKTGGLRCNRGGKEGGFTHRAQTPVDPSLPSAPSCSRRHGAGPVNHRQPPTKTSSVPTPPRRPPGSPCHGPLVTAPGALPLPSACCFSISGPPHSPAWHSFSQCPSLTRRSLRYWLSPFRVPRTVLRLWDRRGARQGVPSHGVGVLLGPTDPNPACLHTHTNTHTRCIRWCCRCEEQAGILSSLGGPSWVSSPGDCVCVVKSAVARPPLSGQRCLETRGRNQAQAGLSRGNICWLN